MTETVIQTVTNLLETALEESDDADVNFNIRTAIQLLDVSREEREKLAETLETAELDRDLREDLAELGYLG